METLVLYALCTASLFYLGSRAVITEPVWRWYPPKVAAFMDCAACSGTWYGTLVGYVGGFHLGLSFLGMPGDRPETVAAVGLCAMAFTPIMAGYVQRGFEMLGSAIPEVESDPDFVVGKPPAPEPEPIAPARERIISGELTNKVPLGEVVAIKDRSGATLGTITIPPFPPKADGEPGPR